MSDPHTELERAAGGLRPGSPMRDAAGALLDEVATLREENRRLGERLAASEERLRASRAMVDPSIRRWINEEGTES